MNLAGRTAVVTGATVALTVVHPGGVATSIARNARKPKDMTAAHIDQSLLGRALQ